MKRLFAASILALLMFVGCNESSVSNSEMYVVDVAVVRFCNDANRSGVQLEVITEGDRRVLIRNDAEILVQRPDFTGFSNTGLWQLGAGSTIKYWYLRSEIDYVAPDYPEYVVHKIMIYASGYPDMPEPTEDDN